MLQKKMTYLLFTVFAFRNVLLCQNVNDSSSFRSRICDSKCIENCKLIFSDQIKRSNVIYMVGEVHEANGNTEIYDFLFEIMIAQNVKHFIFELPYSWNEKLSKFLDDEIKTFEELESTSLYWYKFISKIKEYNLKREKQEKITVSFLDIEGPKYNLTFNRIQEILNAHLKDEKYQNNKLLIDFNKFEAKSNKGRKFHKRFSKRLYELINKNETDFFEIFGDDYYELKNIINSYYISANSIKFNLFKLIAFERHDLIIKREEFMFQNYILLAKKYENSTFFSLNGIAHVDMDQSNDSISGYSNLSIMLNNRENSPFKNNIIPIGIGYNNRHSYINKDYVLRIEKLCKKNSISLLSTSFDDPNLIDLSNHFKYLIIQTPK